MSQLKPIVRTKGTPQKGFEFAILDANHNSMMNFTFPFDFDRKRLEDFLDMLMDGKYYSFAVRIGDYYPPEKKEEVVN